MCVWGGQMSGIAGSAYDAAGSIIAPSYLVVPHTIHGRHAIPAALRPPYQGHSEPAADRCSTMTTPLRNRSAGTFALLSVATQ